MESPRSQSHAGAHQPRTVQDVLHYFAHHGLDAPQRIFHACSFSQTAGLHSISSTGSGSRHTYSPQHSLPGSLSHVASDAVPQKRNRGVWTKAPPVQRNPYGIKIQAAAPEVQDADNECTGSRDQPGFPDSMDQPHHLAVVSRNSATCPYNIISATGWVQVNHPCQPSMYVPLGAWMRQADLYRLLSGTHAALQLRLAGCFHKWRGLLRAKRYHQARAALEKQLLLVQPTYRATLQRCRSLMESSLAAGALAPLPTGTYQLQELKQQQEDFQENKLSSSLARLVQVLAAQVLDVGRALQSTAEAARLAEELYSKDPSDGASKGQRPLQVKKLHEAATAARAAAIADLQLLPGFVQLVDCMLGQHLLDLMSSAVQGMLQHLRSSRAHAHVDVFICDDGSVDLKPAVQEFLGALSKTLMERLLRALKESPRLRAVTSLQPLLRHPTDCMINSSSMNATSSTCSPQASQRTQQQQQHTGRHRPALNRSTASLLGSPGDTRPGSPSAHTQPPGHQLSTHAAGGGSRRSVGHGTAAAAAAATAATAATATGGLVGLGAAAVQRPVSPAALLAAATATVGGKQQGLSLSMLRGLRLGFTLEKPATGAGDEMSQGSHFTMMVLGCEQLAASRRSLDQQVLMSYRECQKVLTSLTGLSGVAAFASSWSAAIYQDQEHTVAQLVKDAQKIRQWRTQLQQLPATTEVGCLRLSTAALTAGLDGVLLEALVGVASKVVLVAREQVSGVLEELQQCTSELGQQPNGLVEYVHFKEGYDLIRGARDACDLGVAQVVELYGLPSTWELNLPHNDQVLLDDVREACRQFHRAISSAAEVVEALRPACVVELRKEGAALHKRAQALQKQLNAAHVEARTQQHFSSLNGGNSSSSVAARRDSMPGNNGSDAYAILLQQLPALRKDVQELVEDVAEFQHQEKVLDTSVGNWDVVTEVEQTWADLQKLLPASSSS